MSTVKGALWEGHLVETAGDLDREGDKRHQAVDTQMGPIGTRDYGAEEIRTGNVAILHCVREGVFDSSQL